MCQVSFKSRCFAAWTAVVLAFAVFGLSPVYAQDSTTGGLRGVVKEKGSGEPAIGATVIATSPSLQGERANITDVDGSYFLPNLPPGTYTVTVYYLDATFSRSKILVQLGKVARINMGVRVDVSSGEKIEIVGSAPIIDQASTKTGNTITKDYTDNLATARSFGEVVGASAGNQDDAYGVSFGGSTSAENTYIVEGINTTDPGFGLLSTNLPNEFVKETEVITGGYKAEYGRATGGIVNVLTKTGSNEFHGSVFGYWTPGAISGARELTPRNGSSIARQNQLDNEFDFGAELGGPIVKDKLWFHVGMNPSYEFNNANRIVRSQVDENQDGVADIDENGFTKFSDPLSRRTLQDRIRRVYYTGKITGAINPDHQGTISAFGNPISRTQIANVTGEESAGSIDQSGQILDISGKWTSKFNNSNTQIDVVAGAHRDTLNRSPTFEAGNGARVRYDGFRDLSSFAPFDANGFVPGGCIDGGPDDPYPNINNCPVQRYGVGGVGQLEDTVASRLVGKIDVTQRMKLAGHHTVKGGFDIEQNGYQRTARYTGGRSVRELANGLWDVTRYFGIDDEGSRACGSFDSDGDGMPDARCGARDAITASTTTRNMSAYLQDDWSVLPNLIFNAGLRWEQQQVFVADEIAGQISPATGERISPTAFHLQNMFAPRIGAIYDPTQEGRSRIYGSWGRFYESIPMDINVRAYGGEITNSKILASDACAGEAGAAGAAGGCDESQFFRGDSNSFDRLLGSGEEVSTPNLRAQFLDELVVGGEYEILPNFKIGAAYIRRDLGRVIEDVSNDGGTTYIVANPGEVDTKGIRDLRNEAAEIRNNMDSRAFQDRYGCTGTANPTGCLEQRAAFREFKAGQFERVGEFDAPSRTYQGIQLTAERRFTDNFYVLASYSYSKTRGNFPRLFSPETGQLDPNLTSMYDLPDLMANRFGDLAADRPHQVKLDSYYQVKAGGSGSFTIGGSFRGASGIPHNALAAHPIYGDSEAFLLPRGKTVSFTDVRTNANGERVTVERTVGRSPFTTQVDAHLAYGRAMGKGVTLEAFVDIFNLFNTQQEVDVDEDYTFDFANPVVGGDSEDLKHAKRSSGENADASLLTRNPNYGNLNARVLPLSMRFGLRLRF